MNVSQQPVVPATRNHIDLNSSRPAYLKEHCPVIGRTVVIVILWVNLENVSAQMDLFHDFLKIGLGKTFCTEMLGKFRCRWGFRDFWLGIALQRLVLLNRKEFPVLQSRI